VKKQFRKRLVIPVAVALVAIIAVSGIAYAYWTSGGSGTGGAGVGTSTSLTVSQTLPAPSNLVPGGPAKDVTVHVVNPATFSQSFSTVTISVTTLPVGCLVGWFTVTNPTPALTVLGAGASTDVTGGQIQMIESGGNQDPCKGASLGLTFQVT
jgi:hypothetical protein